MDNQLIILKFGGAAAILGFVLVFYYYRAKQLSAELWAVDTYDARELRRMCSDNFDATVEVQGTVSCDKPVTSPAMQVECCWCRTTIEREVRGSKGSTHWDQVSQNTLSAIFKLTDETGYVLVDPIKADIETDEPYRTITESPDPWMGILSFFSGETGRYRITEEVFLPTGHAFVLGQASTCGEGPQCDALVHYPSEGYIDPKHRFFIISRKSEKDIQDEQSISLKVCLWASIFAFGFAAYCGLVAIGILP